MSRTGAGAGTRAGAALLFVDAVEGETARLVLSDGAAFSVPVRLLPPGAKEGSWLQASFAIATAPPDDAAEIRARLGQGDDGGDIKL